MSTVPLMDADAQRLYLNAMLSNPEMFARVNQLLHPSYFDPELAKGVAYLQDYFVQNRGIPAQSIFTAATKLPTENIQLNRTDSDFLLNQIAEFCRFRAVIGIIQKAIGKGGYFDRGDLGTLMGDMKKAVEMGLVKDLGIDYFSNIMERLESYDTEDKVISTGWKSVDAMIGGGIGRQELVLFLAPSGGGKSVGMLNLAHNLMVQGLSGVYISLEMKDKKVAMRTDTMLSAITSGMISLNKQIVADEIAKFHERYGCKLFIKRMRESTTTANDIQAYLNELKVRYNFEPDFIVGDYIDIMAPTGRVGLENMFLKDKMVSEEFRALGFDHNAIMISGSQLGKHATEAINEGKKIHQGDIQGGSSKTNTSDLQISMEKTEALEQQEIYRFGFPKARNSDATGKTLEMWWNRKCLRIQDAEDRPQLKLATPRSQVGLGSVVPGAAARPASDLLKGLGKAPDA